MKQQRLLDTAPEPGDRGRRGRRPRPARCPTGRRCQVPIYELAWKGTHPAGARGRGRGPDHGVSPVPCGGGRGGRGRRSVARRRAEYQTDASLYPVPPELVALPRDPDQVEAASPRPSSLGVPGRRGGAPHRRNAVRSRRGPPTWSAPRGRALHRRGPRPRSSPGVVLDDLQAAARPHGGPSPGRRRRSSSTTPGSTVAVALFRVQAAQRPARGAAQVHDHAGTHGVAGDRGAGAWPSPGRPARGRVATTASTSSGSRGKATARAAPGTARRRSSTGRRRADASTWPPRPAAGPRPLSNLVGRRQVRSRAGLAGPAGCLR